MSTAPGRTVPELSHLSLDPMQLAGWFHPSIREYLAWAAHEVEEVTVRATAASLDTSIEVDGRMLVAGGAVTLPLSVGANHYTMTLSAPGAQSRSIALRLIRRHPTPDWRCVAVNRPWPARDSAGELVFDNHLWLFGGYTPKVISDVWRSGDGVDWQQMPDMPATDGVNIPMRWVYNGAMWVTSQRGELLRSVDGSRWEIVTGNLPWLVRKTAGTAVFLGKMWVIGGVDQDGRKNDVWSSTDGANWTRELEHAPWSPRQLWDNVVVHRDCLWVVGGGVQRYHPAKWCRDVWCSPDGKHWELVTEQAPWSGRQWNSCVSYRDRLWMLGGYQSEPKWVNLNDVWWSDNGDQWQQLKTPTIWSPRHELSPYVMDGKLWVVAGNGWPLLNDVWQLDIPHMMFLTQPVLDEYCGMHYRYDAQADFHGGGGPVTYRLVDAPKWLKVDPHTGSVRGQAPDEPAMERVELEATSSGGEFTRQVWTLVVQR